MNDSWVLKALIGRGDTYSDGFYTGKSYIYQGCKYAVVDSNISRAKKYTSYARALRASKMCFDNYSFEVQRLSEGQEANHAE